jgi:hypothetical protein
MKKILVATIMLFLVSPIHASQSIITEIEGSACMGDDKSRKETELLARNEATRRAAEYASTYIKSETHVKDSALESDLISAYANAKVSVLQELEKAWYKDASSGDCYKTKLKVEVMPDQKAIFKATEKTLADDPAAPLNVKVWTDKKQYRKGQHIKIYLKANKPFYGRVVYKDTEGKLVQLLPNPYRKDNYFNGGTVYELPGNGDHYDLEVTPPFGNEEVTVYASTSPLGEIETSSSGGVYKIKTKPQDVSSGTRGVKISAKSSGSPMMPPTAEFTETGTDVLTGK